MDIGQVGIWGSWGWYDSDAASAAEVGTELEDLGFGALWLSGGFGRGVAPYFRNILAGTSRLVVASGIISIWADEAAAVAAGVAELETLAPGRFLLGLGASHAVIVDGVRRPVPAAVLQDGRLPRRPGRRVAHGAA